jgi:hypothetical protein
MLVEKPDHQEDQDVGGWVILKWILEDRMGQWKALVNTVMNLQVP